MACQCLINRIYFGYSFPKRESSSKLYLIKLVKDDARIHQSKMKSRKKYDELYIILRYNRSCNHTENKLVFRISTVSSRYIIYTHIYIYNGKPSQETQPKLVYDNKEFVVLDGVFFLLLLQNCLHFKLETYLAK